jgi:hypothetical protein
MRSALAVSCGLLLGATTLSAHDFWLAAADWKPVFGTSATVTAGVGERFPTRTAFSAREDWLAAWRLIGPRDDQPAPIEWTRRGLEMAGPVNLSPPGAYLGVAIVGFQTTEMKGPEFTAYLKEEGLDAILAARQKAGETDKATIERHSRYAKIAMRSGPGRGGHLTRQAGLRAELVPAADPTSLRAGQSLTVRLFYNGRPVEGATVSAVSQGNAARAATDARGRATFTIDREGPWLIKSIHMIRLPAGSPAEWESFWTTLTFHTAGAI